MSAHQQDLRDRIDRSVDRLTNRLEFDEEIDPLETIQLTPRDHVLLSQLAEHRYLTAPMIALLCWGHFSTRAQARILKLQRTGHTRRFRPRVSPFHGNLQWIYELSVKGAKAIGVEKWTVHEIHEISYAAHDLELNLFMLRIADRAAEEAGCRRVPYLECLPCTWQGDRTSVVLPTREKRPDDADPASELPVSALLEPGGSVEGIVDPDAQLTGIDLNGDPGSLLIEFDRTGRASKLASKFERYDWLLNDGWRRTRFARFPDPPAVLFITKNEAQVRHIVEHAHHALTAHTRFDDGAPTEYPSRNQVGFTSVERIAGGDHRLSLVPRTPSDDTYRTVDFPIHRQFVQPIDL